MTKYNRIWAPCPWQFQAFHSSDFHESVWWLDLRSSDWLQWQPTPVLLPGESHGRRSLVGCSPWGCWELDTTQWLHFHFSLSWIGEGNGNPFQYSCLENPRDSEARRAAIYGVAQSWTRLKWLSSSSSRRRKNQLEGFGNVLAKT